MILADTSVVIDWFRLPSLLTRRIIGSHHPAICGVTLTELLTGIRTQPERSKVMHQLAVFGRVDVEEPVWEIAGRIAGALEAKGARIPFPDIVIIATSIHHGVPLWTRDKHFSRVLDVAPELVLFNESTS
ncbi:MAG TPA: PIN domain-containing protein [Longimicrobium sp.]